MAQPPPYGGPAGGSGSLASHTLRESSWGLNEKRAPSLTLPSPAQDRNISLTSSAPDMSQPDRSRKESEEHPQNMPRRSSAWDVSQAETSRAASETQPLNVQRRLRTREVSQPDTSREASEDQQQTALKT